MGSYRSKVGYYIIFFLIITTESIFCRPDIFVRNAFGNYFDILVRHNLFTPLSTLVWHFSVKRIHMSFLN